MRILQIVKTNEGANWAFEQAQWLSKNDVDIITILPCTSNGMAIKYQSNGMEVIKGDFSLPVNKPWQIKNKVKELHDIIHQVKPDLIHCHFVTNIMMVRIALRNFNIPKLFQVPGPLHLENKFFRTAEIALSDKNDYWAGACKKTCAYYESTGIDTNKVFLAYYGGYGGDAIHNYKESKGILKKQFNILDNKKIIGMVSYFYKPKKHLLQNRGLKGHEDFIDAIAIAKKHDPNIQGIIVGDAWGNGRSYVNRVKEYAINKVGDSIIFTGYRDDIKEIYKDFTLAVHPSHSENLGGAAESLAAGVPTISTNIGGFPDIVINGETGLTVSRKNPKELAEAILFMLENEVKREMMAQNGQQLVKNKLNINQTAANIKDIYINILDR